MAGVHSVEWEGRKGGRDKKELGKRDKGGKMVTDQRRPQRKGATEQKLLFADVDDDVLFILGRGGRRPLLAPPLSPRSLAPISVIIALAKAGHCPLYLSEQTNTSFGAKSGKVWRTT